MNDFNKNPIDENEYRQIVEEISGCLYNANLNRGINVPLAAYMVYKVNTLKISQSVKFEDFFNGELEIKEEILDIVRRQFTADLWIALLKVSEKYKADLFAEVAIKAIRNLDDKFMPSATTPSSVLKLVHKLLAVSPEDRVADICCGCGSYFASAHEKGQQANYFGYDLSTENTAMVLILSELLNMEIRVEDCDVFALSSKLNECKFDKIFSHYPFGIKVRNLGTGYEYFQNLTSKCPQLSKATSSDWVFNSLLCELLVDGGKAVGIMTNGSTWNTIDTPMRKYFVEKKLVECVISLPSRMFSSTVIPTTIIVLSHNNDVVRMIDATNICQQGRRQNEFSEENIKTIEDALKQDTSFSKTVSLDELRKNEYVLNLSRYLDEDVLPENGVIFESIIKNITRAAQCTASQLDALVSESVTNMQYPTRGNIRDGLIDNQLPYISNIEPKQEKYCLKNNSLILSKNGYPYKVAVANINEGQKILANGNLYIIELDEEKANPYYVKAYLESEKGKATLKSITVGAIVPNIGVDKLKKIIIPLPSLEEQNKIAQRYRDIMDEIEQIKIKLEQVTQKLQCVFDC